MTPADSFCNFLPRLSVVFPSFANLALPAFLFSILDIENGILFFSFQAQKTSGRFCKPSADFLVGYPARKVGRVAERSGLELEASLCKLPFLVSQYATSWSLVGPHLICP